MRHLASLLLSIALLTLAEAAPRNSSGKTGTSGKTEKASAPDHGNSLDTVRIHQAYLDGDFDYAIQKIEAARVLGGPFSHADSVFIFKHLGVMYAAMPETREKGKQNMMKLLQTEPSARIMDMYASDMIYMIFKNIQDEFEIYQAKLDRARGHVQGSGQVSESGGGRADGKHAAGGSSRESEAARGKSRAMSWVGWTLGAVAAAGGVALYVHMADEQETARKENRIQ